MSNTNQSNRNKDLINSERFKQKLDFINLPVRTNNPKDKNNLYLSDIDFNFNYRTKLFLYGELKTYGKSFDTGYRNGKLVKTPGHRLRQMSICNDHRSLSYWVNVYHNTDSSEVILLDECIIKEIYVKPYGQFKGEWTVLEHEVMFKDWFYKMLEHNNIIDKETQLQKYLKSKTQ